MQIEGKIIEIGATQQISDRFRKREAMIEEVGAYLGEPEAAALYAGIASGNIKTLVMA